MTSEKIYDSIYHMFGNYEHKLLNAYMFNWESDMFAISKSNYSVEIEVKISRSDYLADFKKEKHKIFSAHNKNYCVVNRGESHLGYRKWDSNGKLWNETKIYHSCIRIFKPNECIPNKFYFACPEGLIGVSEVPSYAGLIYVKDNGGQQCIEIKKAPFLHKNKIDFTAKLMDKYYWRCINAKRQLQQILFHLDEPEKKKIRPILRSLH